MRSPIMAASAAAAACGLLIGGETVAFAWTIDLILMDRLGLSREAAIVGGVVGVGLGLAVSLWTAWKVYRAELALAAAALIPPPAAPEA
ncbi:hypothetical protein C882_0476 [Caenispirillum salinarum AK4]|uniref:Uncharacterized protein n=1 Tax=Caenispirillum salinarum AK4 TaxID=1238182 RepID=K9GWQ1_9PROT|nr:hypothetical protein [Caenispirillum salinarum]EKV29169.1 hypothetical protein C882_0476 [Caenispirillum salinarum AK4]